MGGTYSTWSEWRRIVWILGINVVVLCWMHLVFLAPLKAEALQMVCRSRIDRCFCKYDLFLRC